MRFAFFGDVVGRAGRDGLADHLPALRRRLDLEFVVVNAENAAAGFGITENTARELFDAGADCLTLGNHSWDHMSWTPGCYGLPTLPGNGAAEVTDTAEVIKSYTGKYPKFFRFPGLCHDDEDVAIVAANGERVVDTDISGSDAFAKDGYAVASSIASQAQAGSIIVLHLNGAPNAGTTATIVQNLVPALKAQGLQPVTLSQMA